jgi:hypothetical protein
MKKNERDNIDRIEVISRWLLLKLAEKADQKRDIYLRNAIAKNISLLRSIETLFDNKQFTHAYILFRSLLDRLVYVYYLSDNNLFDSFEEWSFVKSYEHRNNAKADERFQRVLNDPLFKSIPIESHRYSELKNKGLTWEKPDPKSVLKKRGMDFLYKFGYDYASTHTHPMASDGDFEFHQLTGLEPNPHKDFTYEELSLNSVLISTLLMQEILNAMTFKFLDICYTFLDEVRKEINNESNLCKDTFYKIVIRISNKEPLFV